MAPVREAQCQPAPKGGDGGGAAPRPSVHGSPAGTTGPCGGGDRSLGLSRRNRHFRLEWLMSA